MPDHQIITVVQPPTIELFVRYGPTAELRRQERPIPDQDLERERLSAPEGATSFQYIKRVRSEVIIGPDNCRAIGVSNVIWSSEHYPVSNTVTV